MLKMAITLSIQFILMLKSMVDKLILTIYSKIDFYPEAIRIKSDIENLGYLCFLPFEEGYNSLLVGKNGDIDYKLLSKMKNKNNYLKKEFEYINSSHAILLLNYSWNNIDGYIGSNMFLQIGIAYILKKKIFILNTLNDSQIGLKNEIMLMNPIVLKGNVNKIKNYLF